MPTQTLLSVFSLLLAITFAAAVFSAPIYGQNQKQIELQNSGGEIQTSQTDLGGDIMGANLISCDTPPPD